MSSSLNRLMLAGLLTGVTDGLFSGVLSVFFYNSTATRLFQGVASILIGPKAIEGGTPTAALGLLMHFGVAFAWSAVFIFVLMRMDWVQGVLALTRRRDQDGGDLRTVGMGCDVVRGDPGDDPSRARAQLALAHAVHRPRGLRGPADRLDGLALERRQPVWRDPLGITWRDPFRVASDAGLKDPRYIVRASNAGLKGQRHRLQSER